MLLVVSLAISAILIFQATRFWLADQRVQSDDIVQMRRGADLEPGNAEAWDRLGRAHQMDFLNPNLPEALLDYQKAIRIDPLSAHYWIDLAAAYETTGDDAHAQDAFSHAKAVYPASAEVAFYYGNFLLREEKYPEAYGELRRAVVADPTLLPVAISRAWRSTQDVTQLVTQVLPPTTDAYIQAVNFFASRHLAEPALAVWQRVLALRTSVPLPRTFPFLEELIREDRSEDGSRVWFEALRAAGLPLNQPPNGSLIWNGNFATDFTNGGLDWRWAPVPGAAIDFDVPPGPGNSRSIRLDFNGGNNIELGSPLEYVPVEPGRTYHFHASMRTDQITTESGVHFYISDPNHQNAVSFATDDFVGSHPWTALDGDVLTSPQTHFLLVQLSRSPSRLFDNKLGGTVWIADISLVPSRAEAGKVQR
jgi:tetratricopeptide (TPR) repeat protein